MAQSVMSLLEDINKAGTTILMVTHDPSLAARAKRQIYIKDGHVSELTNKNSNLHRGWRSLRSGYVFLLSEAGLFKLQTHLGHDAVDGLRHQV